MANAHIDTFPTADNLTLSLVIVTNLKPDITIWDKFHIFELTLMWTFHSGTLTRQTNMRTLPQTSHTSTQQWQLLKLAALATFQRDNKKSLTSLHKFCKPGIQLSTFIKNIWSLSIYLSYHIWFRDQREFSCKACALLGCIGTILVGGVWKLLFATFRKGHCMVGHSMKGTVSDLKE